MSYHKIIITYSILGTFVFPANETPYFVCSVTYQEVISHADAMCAFRAAAQEGRIQRTPGKKYSESWKVVEASMYTTLNYFVLGAKHIML